MTPPIILLVPFLLVQSLAVSATLDQFLPWLSPNPLALGTSFTDFKSVRPGAVDISGKELNSGEPFEGGLLERLPDGSLFGYSFFDDKLVAANWGSPASPETAELLFTVRNSLLETCGEPISGTTGRIKSGGGVARIVWEQYRPRMDNNYQITLRATSESGIEVELIDGSNARKREIRTAPPSYEEVVNSLPSSISKIDTPTGLVDLLNEARSGNLEANPESREPERENQESANLSAQQPTSGKLSEIRPPLSLPVDELPSSTRWTAVAIIAAIGLLWLFLKKRNRA